MKVTVGCSLNEVFFSSGLKTRFGLLESRTTGHRTEDPTEFMFCSSGVNF